MRIKRMLGIGAMAAAVAVFAACAANVPEGGEAAESGGTGMEERTGGDSQGNAPETEEVSEAGDAAGSGAEVAGSGTADAGSGTEPAEGSDIAAPGENQMLARLAEELNAEQVPPEQLQVWLQTFAAAYDPHGEKIELREAEMDADPETKEWAVVLYEEVQSSESGVVERRTAYGVVIALKEGRFGVHGFEFPEESYGQASIAGTGDLTGDGHADIVWGSVSVGAHTAWATYTVSTWTDGEPQRVQGKAEIPNVSGVAVTDDAKLALTGGLFGSAGAGPWQREYTDEYAVKDHALVRVNRTFKESPTSYHRLLDALWAEELGHADEARRLFQEAIEMDDESYAGYMFVSGDTFMEGGTDPDLENEFAAAVEGFSRFRLALLSERENGAAPAAACEEAKRKAGFDPAWLPLLNSPFGYANPYWDEESVCASISLMFS